MSVLPWVSRSRRRSRYRWEGNGKEGRRSTATGLPVLLVSEAEAGATAENGSNVSIGTIIINAAKEPVEFFNEAENETRQIDGTQIWPAARAWRGTFLVF